MKRRIIVSSIAVATLAAAASFSFLISSTRTQAWLGATEATVNQLHTLILQSHLATLELAAVDTTSPTANSDQVRLLDLIKGSYEETQHALAVAAANPAPFILHPTASAHEARALAAALPPLFERHRRFLIEQDTFFRPFQRYEDFDQAIDSEAGVALLRELESLLVDYNRERQRLMVLTGIERTFTVTLVAEGPAWHIIRLPQPGDGRLQLTGSGTQSNPAMNSQGHVVWQHATREGWEIRWFDGGKVQTLSPRGRVAVNPAINDVAIAWAQRVEDSDEWQVIRYDSTTGESSIYAAGAGAKDPRLIQAALK